jgi:hypothetical protein
MQPACSTTEHQSVIDFSNATAYYLVQSANRWAELRASRPRGLLLADFPWELITLNCASAALGEVCLPSSICMAASR